MPEGPEVRVMADALNTVLRGRQLFNLQYGPKSRYAKTGLTQHAELLAKLPLTIEAVRTKGKKLIFELSSEVYLVSFMGMEGHWVFQPEAHSDLWLDCGHIIPTQPRLLCIDCPLYFDDARHFGSLDIVIGADALRQHLAHIGPDLLQEEISPEMWRQVLTRPRIGHMMVGKFLKEQKYFSGIGNYLRAEIMFAAGISPLRTLRQLTEEEVERLRVTSLRLIRTSYQHGGHTEYTFLDPFGRRGNFPVYVYNQTVDPHGHRIETIRKEGEQTIHWCPLCQK